MEVYKAERQIYDIHGKVLVPKSCNYYEIPKIYFAIDVIFNILIFCLLGFFLLVCLFLPTKNIYLRFYYIQCQVVRI